MISSLCRNVTNSAFKTYKWIDQKKKKFVRNTTFKEKTSQEILREKIGKYNPTALIFMEKNIEDNLMESLRVILIKDKIKKRRDFVKQVSERLKKFGGIKSVDRFVKEVLDEEELTRIQNYLNKKLILRE